MQGTVYAPWGSLELRELQSVAVGVPGKERWSSRMAERVWNICTQ